MMLLLAGLLGGGLSAVALVQEIGPFFALSGGVNAGTEVLIAGPVQPGLSLDSERLVLNGCVQALNSPYGLIQPDPRRSALLSHCLQVSTGINGSTPANSYGWYVTALVAARQADRPLLNGALAHAQQTAPSEEWLGALRVGLAEDHRRLLDEDVLSANDRDLAMLVESHRGIAAIGRRYIDDPHFRERVTEIVERLPAADQKRFVAAVSQAAHE